MTPKIFVASIVCSSGILTGPGTAANPEPAKQEPSAFAQYERSVARRAAVTILEDIRILDAAIDLWAIEHNKYPGDMPKPEDLAFYTKKGTRLHAELSAGRCTDALGNPMSVRGVDRVPLLSKATVQQFAAVTEPGFWGMFYEGPEPSTVSPPPANPTTQFELRTTATWLAAEMRMLDAAIDQWAIEHNKPDGAQARPADLLPYIQKGTRLHGELTAGRTNDSLGNPIKISPVGEIPTINPVTAERLRSVVPTGFWGPFAKE